MGFVQDGILCAECGEASANCACVRAKYNSPGMRRFLANPKHQEVVVRTRAEQQRALDEVAQKRITSGSDPRFGPPAKAKDYPHPKRSRPR